jgi:hypothetical protein
MKIAGLVFRVPVRVWRPLFARKAFRFHPLEQACWTNTASVKRVPDVPAGARPTVFLPWRPAALRTTDAWAGRSTVSFNVVLRYKGWSCCLHAHDSAVLDYNNYWSPRRRFMSTF